MKTNDREQMLIEN